MNDIEMSIADGEMLVDYATRNGITLPDGAQKILRGARTRPQVLRAGGPDRDDFYAALAQVAALVPMRIADIRASVERRYRLDSDIVAAQKLLSYAAANGKMIDDEVRNGLIEAANAVVADRDDRRFLRPRIHDFLRKHLIDQRATLDASNFVFVLRTYVDQAHGALLDQRGNLGR